MRRLVEVFQGECRSLMSQLAEAVAESDVRQVQYLAHTLKGSANLLGAARLGATAFELDRAAKEDRRDDLPRLFEVLQEDAAQVQAALEAFMGSGV